jgi:hypothetical protein
MKKTSNLLPLLLLMLGATVIGSCDPIENGNELPDYKHVSNPTKIVSYDGSPAFRNDVETLIEYAYVIDAMKVEFYKLASNDFETGEAFCATIDDMDKNTTSMRKFWEIQSYVMENFDRYEGALTRLEEEDVLCSVTTTRGVFADALSLLLSFKKSEEEGRKATMAVIAEAGWDKNPAKLQSLFNSLSETQKQGYTNYAEFWVDFSKGKLDKQANRIFNDLYHNDTDFTITCYDLEVKPIGNAIKVGRDLIEKGANVVIDVMPGEMSTVMGIGKDVFNTTEATLQVAVKTYNGTLEREDVQKFLLQWASNAVNYCDRVQTFVESGNLGGFIEQGDANWWGQEFANVILNEGLEFGENIVKRIKNENGVEIDQHIIEAIDKATGEKMDVLIAVDSKTGKAFVTTTKHDDGTFKADPMGTGEKKVTGVNKNGDRSTEKVIVEDTEKKVKVELDTTPEERDDEPAFGDLTLVPNALAFSGEGGTKTVKVSTNYLYYGVKTEDDWLIVKTVPETDLFTVTAAQNFDSEQRTGKVYVLATNREGKVLMTTTLSVTQDKANAVVQVTPTSLTFTAEGGSEVVKVTCPAFSYYGGYPDDEAEGWVSVDFAGEAELVITVKENTKDEERSGFVVVFGTNTENPTYDDIVTARVLIKQDAAGTQPGGELPQFDGGKLRMDLFGFKFNNEEKVQWIHSGTLDHNLADDGDRKTLCVDFSVPSDPHLQSITKNDFSVTTSGNRIYIKSVQDYTIWFEDETMYPNETSETTIHEKFDTHIILEASDFSDYATYKVMDVRAKKYYRYQDYTARVGVYTIIIYETDVELHVNAFFDKVLEDEYVSFKLAPILPQHVKKWDWYKYTELGSPNPDVNSEKDSFSSFLHEPDGCLELKLHRKL